jgi:hypothetical protein
MLPIFTPVSLREYLGWFVSFYLALMRDRPDTRKFARPNYCITALVGGYFLMRRVSGIKGLVRVIAAEV